MDAPANPVAAATHPDPYPYYARLVRERPLYWDDGLGVWVASSAAAVDAVLSHRGCRVRPPGEPVPGVLAGTAAGDVFGRLVRMTDGADQCRRKHGIATALDRVDRQRARDVSRRWAAVLAPAACAACAAGRPGDLTRFMFDMPVHVVATLLGVPAGKLPLVASLVGEFVRGVSPGSPAADVALGGGAAGALLDVLQACLRDGCLGGGLLAEGQGGGLLADGQGGRLLADGQGDWHLANALGLLMQTYDATAGLIGNTLMVLAREGVLREAAVADGALLCGIVDEVLRWDPPIQNTRRWMAEAGVVGGFAGGQAMAAGDGILVVLAAANRDASVNPAPERFDPAREGGRRFTFGHGVHACPGAWLAGTIAVAGVGAVVGTTVGAGFDLAGLAGPVAYRASGNARVPLL